MTMTEKLILNLIYTYFETLQGIFCDIFYGSKINSPIVLSLYLWGKTQQLRVVRTLSIRIYKLEGILMLEGDLKSASNFKDFL